MRSQLPPVHGCVCSRPSTPASWPGLCLRRLPCRGLTAASSTNRATQSGQQPQAKAARTGESDVHNMPAPTSSQSRSLDAYSSQPSTSSYSSIDDEGVVVQSEPDAAPPSPGTALPPVQLRMPHPTAINTSRERHWALLQELVPRQDWQKIAVVLACVEAIHRSEFLQYGQAAVAALQAANAAHVPTEPEPPLSRRSSRRRRSSASVSSDDEGASSRSRSSSSTSPSPSSAGSLPTATTATHTTGSSQNGSGAEATKPQEGSSAATQQARIDSDAASSRRTDSGNSSLGLLGGGSDEDDDGGGGGSSDDSSSGSTEPLQVPEPETLEETAARLDLELASLVTLLARRSAFQPLSRRDVEVSKVLNKDYLSQLFIVGDLRRMDRSLVKAMAQAGLLTRRSAVGMEGAGAQAAAFAVQDVLSEKPSPGSFDWAQPLPSSGPASKSPSVSSSQDAPLGLVVSPARQAYVNGHKAGKQDSVITAAETQPPPAVSVNGGGSGDNGSADRGFSTGRSGRSADTGHPRPTNKQPESAISRDVTPMSRDVTLASHARSTSPDPLPASNAVPFTDLADSTRPGGGGKSMTRSPSLAASSTTTSVTINTASPSNTRADPRKASPMVTLPESHIQPQPVAVLSVDRPKIQSPSPALLGLLPEELQQVAEELGAVIDHGSDAGGVARGVPHAELLAPEAAGLVLLRRSWGEEESTGRLMVQKLDYLQTQAVTWVLDYVRSAAVSAAASLQDSISRTAEEVRLANAGLYEEALGRSHISDAHDARDDGDSQAEQHQLLAQLQALESVDQAHSHDKPQEHASSQPSPAVADQSPLDVSDQSSTPDVSFTVASRMEQPGGSQGEDGSSSSLDGGGSWHRDGFRRSASPSVEARPDSPGLLCMMQATLITAGSAADLGNRLSAAGRAWAQWFSDRGVGPRMDVMALPDIDNMLPVAEPNRLSPLTLRKVALAEVLGTQPFSQSVGNLLKLIIQPVKLQQPTFKEFVVVYRRMPDVHRGPPSWLQVLQQAGRRLKLLSSRPPSPPKPRHPVQIRIYRDLPLPTWQLALPDKLLQFRPLDLLRADLFALIGLVALLAQARYDSLLLDILTFISATVFIVRIALGFKRMDDRYRNQVAEVLREKTVATNAAALEFLAAAAALQQFKQASLAYVYALQRQSPEQDVAGGASGEGVPRDARASATWGVPCEQLADAMEALLLESCGQQVMFDAEEAVAELVRLGLASIRPLEVPLGVSSVNSTETDGNGLSHGLQYRVVDSSEAMRLVQQHWDGLLWQRVDGILREFE